MSLVNFFIIFLSTLIICSWVLVIYGDSLMDKLANKMFNIGDEFIEKDSNPFNKNVKYAKIVNKRFSENGVLWIEYRGFTIDDNGELIYECDTHTVRYKDFVKEYKYD